MDAFQVILEAGYSISQEDFFELIDALEIPNKIGSVH